MHIDYYVNNIRVPSVTEVISLLYDYSLLKWANRLGFSFIDIDAYLEEASKIGSETHEMISSYFKKEQIQTCGEVSRMYYERFLEFVSKHTIEPILIEQPMVSERYLYGGTLDLFCKLDGVYTLIDFKTGFFKKKHEIQLSAYRNMLLEKGYTVDKCIVVSFKKGVDEYEVTNFEDNFRIFLLLLEIYRTLSLNGGVVSEED